MHYLSYLGVLFLSEASIEDLAYRDNAIDYIEIKSDIELACLKLNITSPISADDAKKISRYLSYE